MKLNYTYVIFIIIILLFLLVQYHNYCTNNKLRHTIFGIFDYFHIINKQICHKSLHSNEENI